MKEKKRILLVDCTLYRAGIKALLSDDHDIEIAGEANNGLDAVSLTSTLAPDLVLTDLTLPDMNGIEVITEITRRYPEVRILVLTTHKTDEYIHQSLRAGAKGYLLKDATQYELRTAIHSVLNGKTYLNPTIAAKVIDTYLGTDAANTWDTLTHREKEVLKLVAEGRQNKHIAEFFSLSVKTVEKHRSNLMKKLNLHNASMMTSYAINKGLVCLSKLPIGNR